MDEKKVLISTYFIDLLIAIMYTDKDCGYDSDSILNEAKLVEGQPRLSKIDSHDYSMYPYKCIGLIIGND